MDRSPRCWCRGRLSPRAGGPLISGRVLAATLLHRPAPAGVLRAMKTYVATPKDRERNWLVVDAAGQPLGRLSTQIADALRGKRKPAYTPHVDTGDFVVVINAEKIAV